MNRVAARVERRVDSVQLLRQGKHASSSVDVDDDCHRGVILLTWSTATVSDEGMKISHVHAIRKRALDGGDKRLLKKDRVKDPARKYRGDLGVLALGRRLRL